MKIKCFVSVSFQEQNIFNRMGNSNCLNTLRYRWEPYGEPDHCQIIICLGTRSNTVFFRTWSNLEISPSWPRYSCLRSTCKYVYFPLFNTQNTFTDISDNINFGLNAQAFRRVRASVPVHPLENLQALDPNAIPECPKSALVTSNLSSQSEFIPAIQFY